MGHQNDFEAEKEMEEFFGLFLDSLAEEDEIYHYTDINGLLGIVENKAIWLTEASFLNDVEEQLYTLELFENEVLNTIVDKKLKNTLSDAIESLRNRRVIEIESLRNRRVIEIELVFSCSLDADNLTLWSEFSNAYGYCLGLNHGEIYNALKDGISGVLPLLSSLTSAKVIYDREDQIKKLKEVVKKSIEISFKDHNIALPQDCFEDSYDHVPESTLRMIGGCVTVACKIYSVFFKRPEYAAEREYRFYAMGSFGIENLQFRNKNGIPLPFIEIKNDRISESFTSIKIGPKIRDKETVLRAIHMLCKKNGVINNRTKSITASAIDLRF